LQKEYKQIDLFSSHIVQNIAEVIIREARALAFLHRCTGAHIFGDAKTFWMQKLFASPQSQSIWKGVKCQLTV